MRTEQIRLAKAANISPEELDGVNLIWYAIGRIEGMQNYINELESAIKNLHKVKGRYHTQEACVRLFEAVGLTNNIGLDAPIDTTILEELRKDRDLLQFCLDNDTFPVKDQSGAYIMSKDNEFFSVSDSPRKSIELAFEYVKFKADNVMRGGK